MTQDTTKAYEKYAANTSYLSDYNAYQDRYAGSPRESDKVILRMIAELAPRLPDQARVCDLGCSTGNLLSHVRSTFPRFSLSGIDISESSIAAARQRDDLQGVELRVGNIVEVEGATLFDIVILNAVFFYMDDADAPRLLAGVNRALRPGGHLIMFDWMTPFRHQSLTITERSLGHPAGMTYRIRPLPEIEAMLAAAGFTDARFQPFALPIDLPFPGFETELVSFTRTATDGERLCFRGVLFQPWYHMRAGKAGAP